MQVDATAIYEAPVIQYYGCCKGAHTHLSCALAAASTTPALALHPSAPPVVAFHYIVDFIHADVARWVSNVSDNLCAGAA